MFKKALPVWLDGLSSVMNVQANFDVEFEVEAHQPVAVTLTAASLYRLTLNGAFVAYGPARAPHDYARVDQLDLSGLVVPGPNRLQVEVAGYHCLSFYTLKQGSFLCAEVLVNDKPVVWTGRHFTGKRNLARLQKVMRYSFQRTFSEVWDLERPAVEATLQVRPAQKWLPRGTAPPDYTRTTVERVVSDGTFVLDPSVPAKKNRYIQGVSHILSGFPEAELEATPTYVNQQQRFTPSGNPPRTLAGERLSAGDYVVLDAGRNFTGFLQCQVKAAKSCRFLVTWDEKLVDGVVDPQHIDMVNVVDYRLPGQAQPYHLETFEVYEFRYVLLSVLEGELELSHVGLRSYIYPLEIQSLGSGRPVLDGIYQAAQETWRQNTLDVYMDCPSRERGGWLCDSYFLAQAEFFFTGKSDVERVFLKNFVLNERNPALPPGALPMCYPADHGDAAWIPQWCLWYVLELDQFLVRCPDVDKSEFQRLCLDLVGLLEQYANGQGLLERLPGWNFVEWSKANDWVQDVNYPTNMLYARVLEILGNLYDQPALLERCRKIREVVLRLSYNGTFFTDNAVRDPAGNLVNTGNVSEVCQYYASVFGLVDLEQPAWSEFRERLLTELGPKRAAGVHAGVEPANAFMGLYLRLEVLLKLGEHQRLIDEVEAFFGPMAESSGTLWEHKNTSASLNHGFASFAGVALRRALA